MSESIDGLLKKLNDIGGDIEKTLENGLHNAAKKIQADAKRLAPTETGRLRNSITTKVYREANDVVATVGSVLKYAPYVEFGTGPVGERSPKIVPKGLDIKYKQDGWRYMDEDGEWHYTYGQSAQPFLYPALKQNEKDIAGYIAKSIRSEIKAGQNEYD